MDVDDIERAISELRSYAITHPCASDKNLSSLRYARRINGRIAFLHIYRKLGVFGGIYCWHASVYIPATLGPKPLANISKSQRQRLHETACNVLAAVGTSEEPEVWRSEQAIHLSKPLNEEELVAHRSCCHNIFALPIFS